MSIVQWYVEKGIAVNERRKIFANDNFVQAKNDRLTDVNTIVCFFNWTNDFMEQSFFLKDCF